MYHMYPERAIPTKGAYFGEGSGPIHLSVAQCSNKDTRLTDCNINKTGISGCKHSEDAGVICMGTVRDELLIKIILIAGNF